MRKEKKIALFDMDGTLFDYEGALKNELLRLASPNEILIDDDFWAYTKNPWIAARVDLIKSIPGWWRNLPKLQLGWDIRSIALSLGYDIHILSKGPSVHDAGWTEKIECIRNHFGNIPIHLTTDKSIQYGRILVDDYPEYILNWLEFRERGLVIMPVTNSSLYEQVKNNPNVISYTGDEKELPFIRKCMEAAFNRQGGQHWRELL